MLHNNCSSASNKRYQMEECKACAHEAHIRGLVRFLLLDKVVGQCFTVCVGGMIWDH